MKISVVYLSSNRPSIVFLKIKKVLLIQEIVLNKPIKVTLFLFFLELYFAVVLEPNFYIIISTFIYLIIKKRFQCNKEFDDLLYTPIALKKKLIPNKHL